MLAILCAKAARQRQLDLFGIYTAADLTARVGGIFRDPRPGALVLPPFGLSDPRFFSFSIAAAGGAVAGGLTSWPVVVKRGLTASICIRLLPLCYGWNPCLSREPNA